MEFRLRRQGTTGRSSHRQARKILIFFNFKTLCLYHSLSEIFSRLEPLDPSVHEVVPFWPAPVLLSLSLKPCLHQKRPLLRGWFLQNGLQQKPITQTQILWGKLRVSKKRGNFSSSSSSPPPESIVPHPSLSPLGAK